MKNRRTFMTKRIIKESLVDMLKRKSMDKITVSALCEEADINRSTFYSHYSDVCDVLEEMKTEFIADYMPFAIEIDMKNHSIEKENFMKFFDCVKTQKEVLSVLVDNTSIINDVTQPMRKNIKNLYLSFWGKVPKSYEIYLDADATYITFGFFATVNRWLELGCTVDPTYLYDMLDSLTKELFDKLKAQIDGAR